MKGLIEKTVERVLLGDSCSNDCADDFGSEFKIVVCQRGFVYAGDVLQVGDYIVISNAVNLRYWGTSEGLGELARKGNLPETKADACGSVRVHKLAVVALMDCEERIHATT